MSLNLTSIANGSIQPFAKVTSAPPVQADTRRGAQSLSRAETQPRPRANNLPGTAPNRPTFAPSVRQTCTPTLVSLPPEAASIPVNEARDPIMKESAPFHAVTVAVRSANKTAFEPARQALKKSMPGFDKAYEDYRRWRDSPPDKLQEFKHAGMKAQRAIMDAAGVTEGQQRLFELLSNPPSPLLRFISPVNGDFRAPKAGLIAGLRFANDHGVEVPTLVFPGTGAGSMIRAQMQTNYRQFFGKCGVPEAHRLAVSLAKQCQMALDQAPLPRQPIAFSGHSLGGGIASYAAATIARPDQDKVPRCYTFNPAALGAATLADLAKHEDLKKRVEHQKIIRIKNDHVSSPAMQERLMAIFGSGKRSRVVVPRHVGQIHVVRRELLDKSHQSVIMLHSLESLSSVYDSASEPRSGAA